MSPQPPPEPGKDVLALNSAVTRQKRQLQALEERDHANSSKIAELGEQLATIVELLEKEKGQSLPAAWNWVGMDQDQAGTAWEQLITWRREVFRTRWPSYWAQTTQPCWYQHKDVVEDLSILYTTWCAAWLDPKAKPRQAAEWVDRLPAVCRRIAEHLQRCQRGHQEPWAEDDFESPPPRDHDDEELSAWIMSDLDRRAADAHTADAPKDGLKAV